MKYLAIIIFALLAFSCLKKKNHEAIIAESTILIEDVGKTSSQNLSEWIEDVNLIPLEFGDGFMLGKVEKLRILDDKIFVLDKMNRSGVFSFDMQGNFLRQIGTLGEGPEEIRFLTEFDLDEEHRELWIYDNLLKKLSIFDLEGKFLHTVDVPFAGDHFAFHRDTLLLYRNDPPLDQKTGLNLFDREGKFLGGYFESRPKKIGLVVSAALASISYKKERLFFKRLDTNIYRVDKRGLSAPWAVDFGANKITPELKKRIESDPVDSWRLLDEDKVVADIRNVHDFEHILAFDYVYLRLAYTVFYNKKDHTYLHSHDYVDDISGLFFTRPISQYKGDMVGVYDPHQVKHNIDWLEKRMEGQLGNMSGMENTSKLLQGICSKYMDMNPILVFYKLKSI